MVERLAVLNRRYIAMAGGAGGNWHNLWTDLEGSTTDALEPAGWLGVFRIVLLDVEMSAKS